MSACNTDMSEYNAFLRGKLIAALSNEGSGMIIEGGNVLSRPELLTLSQSLARKLEQSRRNGPVLIIGARGIRLLAFVAACLLANRTFAIADPGVPSRRIEAIKDVLSCESVVDLRSDADEILHYVVPVDNDASRKIQGATYVVFTSGSTGTPKGVVVGPESYIPFSKWFLEELALTASDTYSSVNPAHFDNFIADMTIALFSSCTISFLPDPAMDLAGFREELGSTRPTHWFSVPSLIKFLDNLRILDAQNMSNLRWMGFGGEPFFVRDIRLIATKLPKSCVMVNVYGPSETTCISSMTVVSQEDLDSENDYPSIGFMNKNFDSWLDGESGELVLSGVQVSRGYLRSDSASFICEGSSRTYRTGDIMSLESTGYRFLSRKDRQVKLMGHRIELNEVEAVCKSLDGVQDAMAVVCTQFGQSVLGVVFCGDLDERQLAREVLAHAPKYLVPKISVKVESLPTNRNGKRDYLKVTEMLEGMNV